MATTEEGKEKKEEHEMVRRESYHKKKTLFEGPCV